MIFEYRVYHAHDYARQPLTERVLAAFMGHVERHGATVVGCWTTATTISSNSSQVMYMLAFDDLSHLERVWADVRSDPAWHADLAALTENGALPIATHFSSQTMTPVERSPSQ